MTAILLMLTVGCSGKYNDILGLDADPAAGAEVFSANCASCHGASGEGDIGPAMSEAVTELSEDEFLATVFNGTDEGMPAFALSDQEAADLVAYCDETFGGFGSGGGDDASR